VPKFDQSRKDFAPYGFTCVRWAPTLMPRSDRHNEIELNLLEQGSVSYLLGGQKVSIPAGRLALFWAGMPHQIIGFESQAEYFVLTIPLVWFLQWRLPDAFVKAVLHGGLILEPEAGRLASDRIHFQAWLEDVSAPSEERHHISLLEIEARLRRLALTVAPAASGPRRKHAATVLGQGGLSKAEQMAAFIAQHYAEPISIDKIGREVGLHPNYAMNVFQRAFGTTLGEYVTQHRLSHAQRLLVTTEDLILNIALNSGFGSLSRFNEAFRQAFGCTPRDYRKEHQLA
jgi:AraC-like DNA-binding protein